MEHKSKKTSHASDLKVMFIASFLVIFAQLGLIRYIGSEIGVFAYLQNIILTACFIGFSVGLRAPISSKRGEVFCVALAKLLGLIVVVGIVADWGILATAVSFLGKSYVAWNIFHNHDWSSRLLPSVIVGLAVIFYILILTSSVFVPLGRVIASSFKNGENPLTPYLYNLGGSIAGVLGFYLVSYLSLGPQWWFLIMGCGALAITSSETWRGRIHQTVVILPALLVFAGTSSNLKSSTIWSPYQKLNLEWITSPPYQMEGGYIRVNNSGYQIMLDLAPSKLLARPELYSLGLEGYTHYDLPFRFRPNAKSALILGAGSGNDAAAALRADVSSVVAVEIDPVIINFGKVSHPEMPYSDKRVRTEVTDARSYLHSTQETFDVISFGLLDSHTGGAMTNARLDHFVYTREAFEAAAARLAKGGVITLMFEASKPYITARMAAMMRETLGQSPLMLRIPPSAYGFGGVMLITGDPGTIQKALDSDPKLSSLALSMKYEIPDQQPEMTTDDWPYVYLDGRTIPPLFGVSTLMVIGLFGLVRRRCSIPPFGTPTRDDIVMALLGGAFFLLEVAQISRTAVILGISWQPSAAIILGILSMAFLSTLWARKKSPSMTVSGLMLVTSLIFLLIFDMRTLLSLSYPTRFIAAATITCIPVFFSGLIFSTILKNAREPGKALSWNLLGAVFGACAQSLSLLIGLKALLYIVMLLYVIALALQISNARLAKENG